MYPAFSFITAGFPLNGYRLVYLFLHWLIIFSVTNDSDIPTHPSLCGSWTFPQGGFLEVGPWEQVCSVWVLKIMAKLPSAQLCCYIHPQGMGLCHFPYLCHHWWLLVYHHHFLVAKFPCVSGPPRKAQLVDMGRGPSLGCKKGMVIFQGLHLQWWAGVKMWIVSH